MSNKFEDVPTIWKYNIIYNIWIINKIKIYHGIKKTEKILLNFVINVA